MSGRNSRDAAGSPFSGDPPVAPVLFIIIVGDVNVDHRAAHGVPTVTLLFFSVTKKYLGGKYFEAMHISCFSSYFPPPIFRIVHGSWQQLRGTGPTVTFHFSHF